MDARDDADVMARYRDRYLGSDLRIFGITLGALALALVLHALVAVR